MNFKKASQRHPLFTSAKVGLAIKLLRPLLFVHHAKLLCRWQASPSLLLCQQSVTARRADGDKSASPVTLYSAMADALRSTLAWPSNGMTPGQSMIHLGTLNLRPMVNLALLPTALLCIPVRIKTTSILSALYPFAFSLSCTDSLPSIAVARSLSLVCLSFGALTLIIPFPAIALVGSS